jgi:ribonuclease HII
MSLKSSAKASRAKRRISRVKFDAQFGVPVCGIDEAGRGPLAGPVVTACVYIPPEHIKHPVWRDVADSKQLLPQKREYLYGIIIERCIYAVAEANVEEIDTLNIHHATLLAMKRAYEGMVSHPYAPPFIPPQAGGESSQSEDRGEDNHLALIDGKFAPPLSCKTQAVIKGDDLSLSIAAASILAKVTRDRYMTKLHEEFPHYCWNKNAGYSTPDHFEGIKKYGVTIHHRKSFAPCREAKAA